MLPQFGLSEFLLLAGVALIVLGPKDLSKTMRELGRFVAKGRKMAGEFQAAFDDIARQTELDDLRKEIEALKRENAVTQAVEDMRAAEKDINDAVMRDTQKAEQPEPEEAAPEEPDSAGPKPDVESAR